MLFWEPVDYRDPDWLAARLGMDKNTIYKFLQDGTIPALHLGRKWLISEARVTRWLQEETDRQTNQRRTSTAAAVPNPAVARTMSDDTRVLLRAAYSEARELEQRHLDLEHLLLAMLGQSAPAIAAKLRGTMRTTPRKRARQPRAKFAIQFARALARDGGARLVSPEHLAMGLIQSIDQPVHKLLRKSGLDFSTVRAAIPCFTVTTRRRTQP